MKKLTVLLTAILLLTGICQAKSIPYTLQISNEITRLKANYTAFPHRYIFALNRFENETRPYFLFQSENDFEIGIGTLFNQSFDSFFSKHVILDNAATLKAHIFGLTTKHAFWSNSVYSFLDFNDVISFSALNEKFDEGQRIAGSVSLKYKTNLIIKNILFSASYGVADTRYLAKNYRHSGFQLGVTSPFSFMGIDHRLTIQNMVWEEDEQRLVAYPQNGRYIVPFFKTLSDLRNQADLDTWFIHAHSRWKFELFALDFNYFNLSESNHSLLSIGANYAFEKSIGLSARIDIADDETQFIGGISLTDSI